MARFSFNVEFLFLLELWPYGQSMQEVPNTLNSEPN